MKTLCKGLFSTIACILLTQSYLSAQDKLSLKFGKVSPADFDLSSQKFDSSAGGVYIADIGSSEFEGNSKGWFSLIYKRHARIKILKKDGFDLANVEIPVYTSGDAEEKVSNIKAATYQLENGNVVTTKLDESTIFKDRINKNLVIKKFTLPAVKEGSIIEFSYTITSDFLFNLQPWNFQGGYPRLWSEYNVRMPDFFNYVFLSQGSTNFDINTTKESFGTFTIIEPNNSSASSYYKLNAIMYDKRWVMKNVPALKEEPYTTSLSNHLSKIEFQLSQYRFPNTVPKDIMGNWVKVNEEMMKDEEFGAYLTKTNNWLDDDIKVITANTANKLEKAQKIFAYVRDNYTCTNTNGKYLTTSLKNTFKARKGSVADINLLLVAMLKHEDINANPVILSTRNHGLTHELYPLMDRFNYVIASITDDSKTYYLDATEPKMGFNRLPIRCYNGHSRVIGETTLPVYLDADSVKERKVTFANFIIDEKGTYKGVLNSNLSYYESLSIREKIAEKGKEEFFKSMKTSFPSEFELSQLQVDSLSNYDLPVGIKYAITPSNFGTEDIIYFNPMLAEGYKDNLFKSTERAYPVEMPYTIDETYILNMQIPAGYVVDELPQSTRVALNDNEGSFEYIISKTETMVQMRSRIQLKKANFLAEDYEGLRDFFGHIVKKHSEQVVFKKKK